MRLMENQETGEPSDSAGLMETHETQRDYLGLMKLMILINNKEDS